MSHTTRSVCETFQADRCRITSNHVAFQRRINERKKEKKKEKKKKKKKKKNRNFDRASSNSESNLNLAFGATNGAKVSRV